MRVRGGGKYCWSFGKVVKITLRPLRKYMVPPFPFNGANPSEIRNREKESKNDGTSESLAQEPRRGFSTNTFPIAHLLASLWPRWGMFEGSLSISLFPFYDTCPSEKFPRIALSRRTSRCPTRVPLIRARITGGGGWEMGMWGQGVPAFLCVIDEEKREREWEKEREKGRMRYALDDFEEFYWCSNLM